MLAMRIDRIDPGLGIEAMTLVAPRVEDLQPEAIAAKLSPGTGRRSWHRWSISSLAGSSRRVCSAWGRRRAMSQSGQCGASIRCPSPQAGRRGSAR
jgi:hypothetical protein